VSLVSFGKDGKFGGKFEAADIISRFPHQHYRVFPESAFALLV
jgi:hypothetical protein